MQNINLSPRPPVVVVTGHIDHGKTTLLDYIRKTSVAAVESGGITQHIGAYEVIYEGKSITFIDTPGHEAFGKMRSRGAKVADLAILVVAADDGVKPQTKDALASINDARIPFCVAINKIDKDAANPEKVKNELAEAGVLLEGRGGNVPYVEISAKAGTNITRLLETVLLIAELEDLRASFNALATGVVIESHRDPRRGVTATLLIKNGEIRKGEFVVAGDAVAKVKILENFCKQAVKSAGPSSPVVVVGFDKLPAVGAEFKTAASQNEAEAERATAKQIPDKRQFSQTGDGKTESMGLVIKTDFQGSSEAICHEIDKLRVDRIEFKILRAGAGDISEDDIKLVSSTANPVVIGFRVKVHLAARELAERMGVEIFLFDVIYEIGNLIKQKINEVAPPRVENVTIGKAEVVRIFPSKLKGQIMGGKVSEGRIIRGASFRLLRRGNQIAEGKISNLQSGKINVSEVAAGSEFGAQVISKVAVAKGDVLETNAG